LKVAKDKKTAARGFALSDPPAPGSPEFGRLLESLTGSAVRCGNRVEVLRNGDQIFPAMVQSIRSAQATIDFSTYMYWAGGETIAAIGEALVERACAGVQISILLDAVGSAAKMDRELVERLREAGATVQWFRPPSWYTSCLSRCRIDASSRSSRSTFETTWSSPTGLTSTPGEIVRCASGSSSERSLQYATAADRHPRPAGIVHRPAVRRAANAPTLEGQHVIKDIIFVASGFVVASTLPGLVPGTDAAPSRQQRGQPRTDWTER